jgi:hypothetical protein
MIILAQLVAYCGFAQVWFGLAIFVFPFMSALILRSNDDPHDELSKLQFRTSGDGSSPDPAVHQPRAHDEPSSSEPSSGGLIVRGVRMGRISDSAVLACGAMDAPKRDQEIEHCQRNREVEYLFGCGQHRLIDS